MTVKRTYEEIIKKHNFSVKEINFMKHALGIDSRSISKGKCLCYRNYFNAGIDTGDFRIWEHLCFVGFANMYAKEMYEVTPMGVKFLEDILSAEISFY